MRSSIARISGRALKPRLLASRSPPHAWHGGAAPWPSAGRLCATTVPKATAAAEVQQGAAAEASSEAGEDAVEQPTGRQLRRHFVASAVPMIAFGIMDQTVLIHAGDTIDATLGVRLGLPTLGAAALGQVFSDTSGVLFGGTIEAMALKLGLPLPGLTDAQRNLGIVKKVATFGSVCGVVLGCLIGMANLCVIDLHAAERAKRAEELKTIMKTVMEDGRNVLECDRATLWIVDEKAEELWSSVAHGESGVLRIPSAEKTSIAGWVAHNKQLANIPCVREDPRWYGNALGVYVPSTMICAPVLSTEGKVIAVIQALDKQDGNGHFVPFDKNDEKILQMLTAHTRIFMEKDE